MQYKCDSLTVIWVKYIYTLSDKLTIDIFSDLFLKTCFVCMISLVWFDYASVLLLSLCHKKIAPPISSVDFFQTAKADITGCDMWYPDSYKKILFDKILGNTFLSLLNGLGFAVNFYCAVFFMSSVHIISQVVANCTVFVWGGSSKSILMPQIPIDSCVLGAHHSAFLQQVVSSKSFPLSSYTQICCV